MAILLISFVVIFLAGSKSAEIVDLTVPETVIIDGDGSENVELACDFRTNLGDSNFVMKWFKDDAIMYQWINGQPPSVLPDFRDYIDNNYHTSIENDSGSSKIQLINPSVETTGTYKCVVQTKQSTTSMEKNLQIVDIQNYTLNLKSDTIRNETHLECTVKDVYPEPTLHITSANQDTEISVIAQNRSLNPDGYFEAFKIAVVDSEIFGANDFQCIVDFINTEFNLTTTAVSGCSKCYQSQFILLLIVLLTLNVTLKITY